MVLEDGYGRPIEDPKILFLSGWDQYMIIYGALLEAPLKVDALTPQFSQKLTNAHHFQRILNSYVF